MVRIGGGVFPDIKEKDYLGEGGYRVDDKAGKVRRLPRTMLTVALHAAKVCGRRVPWAARERVVAWRRTWWRGKPYMLSVVWHGIVLYAGGPLLQQL